MGILRRAQYAFFKDPHIFPYYPSKWLHKEFILPSGGSRNFKTGGRGHGAVEFIGCGDCFDVPLHIPNGLAVRVENKTTCCMH